MKTTLYTTLLLATLLISSTAFAQNKALRKEKIDPVKRYARTGGIVVKEHTGPYILFFNQQNTVNTKTIQKTVSSIQKVFNLPCRLQSGASVAEPISALANAKLNPKAAVVIGIGTSDSLPSLLVAPETGWVFVNVKPLKEGTSEAVLQERLNKEIWRAFAYVMGAAHTEEPHACLMKPVLQPTDLDALNLHAVSPIPAGKIATMADKLGLQSRITTTYAKAIQEGWAPAPKDDVQRALWKKYNKTPPKQ